MCDRRSRSILNRIHRKVVGARLSTTQWLVAHPSITLLLEIYFAVVTLINAVQVFLKEGDKPAAPFMIATVNWLGDLAGPLWAIALLLTGVTSLLLAPCAFTNRCSLAARAINSFCLAALWSIAFYAVLVSGNPFGITSIYFWRMTASWVVAMILIVQHDFKKEPDPDVD